MALRVPISNMPANGGDPITDIESRRNASDATIASLGGNSPGTYDVPGSTITDSVQIRPVNSVGPGAWSDTKTLSAGNPELLSNPSFDSAATWAGTAGTTAFTISGGNLTITKRGDSFLDGVAQPISFTAGTVYDITVTVVSAATAGVRIKIDGFDVPGLTPLTTPGTYTAQYTSPSAATRNFIVSASGDPSNVVVSAVSLKVAP
jgi:hypothetical protein